MIFFETWVKYVFVLWIYTFKRLKTPSNSFLKVSQARNKKTAVVQADQESSNNVCTTNQPNPKGEEEGARANFYMIAICPKKVGQFHPLFFCFEGEDLLGKEKIKCNSFLGKKSFFCNILFSTEFCLLLEATKLDQWKKTTCLY